MANLFNAIAPENVEKVVSERAVYPQAQWTRIATVGGQSGESHDAANEYRRKVADHTVRETKKEEYSGCVSIYAAV